MRGGVVSLRTVRAPPDLASLFGQAEQVVDRYFAARRDEPERGTIEIGGERYVLVRAASLSVDFFATVGDLFGPGREAEADEFARNILYDLAHAVGRSDARDFHARMGLSDPMAKMSAGPLHFAHTGWAFVDIGQGSNTVPDESYWTVYDHLSSFEADAWVRAGVRRELPACIMGAGYSSGWCEESFGMELVSAEVSCRACGDPTCRFVMAPPSRIEGHVRLYLDRLPPPERDDRRWQIPDFFSRKRMEEELRRAHADLERRVGERTAELRREMAQRAAVERRLLQKHKLDALGQLAGGIAHDFNNLMGIVLANCDLLALHAADDPVARRRVALISAAGERAADLTRRLLAFSRAEAPGFERLDLDALVSGVAQMIASVIGEHIALTLDLAGAAWVEADPAQLEQVLVNLAINARDAMPGGGRLTLSTEVTDRAAELGGVPPGRYAVVTVADTGVGMDPDTATRSFEPFFTTRADAGGTGLGLSTAYGVVRQHRGEITVDSVPGHGSRFRVILPAVDAPSEPAPVPEPPATASLPGGAERILVVEDQEPLRQVVGDLLRGLGYEVLLAASPEEAIALPDAELARVGLLLTDVRMPRTSGVELATRLCARRPDLRVLYMSGYTRDLPSVAGGADLLEKPFTLGTLARRVRAALDRAVSPGG